MIKRRVTGCLRERKCRTAVFGDKMKGKRRAGFHREKGSPPGEGNGRLNYGALVGRAFFLSPRISGVGRSARTAGRLLAGCVSCFSPPGPSIFQSRRNSPRLSHALTAPGGKRAFRLCYLVKKVMLNHATGRGSCSCPEPFSTPGFLGVCSRQRSPFLRYSSSHLRRVTLCTVTSAL